MAYEKVPRPSTVYHLTKKEHLDSILDDGVIRRFDDTECWFCESLEKMKAYMAQTVLCEGKPYYAVGGQLCRYPKFVPEDYVLLKLTPCGYEDILTAIQGTLDDNNNRLCRILFKCAVELNMLCHTIAAHFRTDPIHTRELRAYAVDEVKRTNGQVSFESAVHQQRRIEPEDEWPGSY